MNRLIIPLVSLLFAASCSSPAPEGEPSGGATSDAVFYTNIKVLSGDNFDLIDDAVMLVQGGKIVQVGKKGEVTAPKGSGRIEFDGEYFMPVMVNLNAHPGLNSGASFGPSNYNRDSVVADINRYGYYGVFAVASSGGDAGDIAVQVRDDQKAGKEGGALLFTGGRGITAKGGYPTGILKDIPMEVSTESEALKAVKANVDMKADFITIWVDDNMGRSPKLKPEISSVVISDAHKQNLKVFAHVFALSDAKDLVKAGVDGLINSIRDREVDDELISAMKAKNVFLAPALTAQEAKFVYADKPKWLGEQTMREVYPGQLASYLMDDVTVNKFKRNGDLPALRQQYATAVKNLKKMSDAGVKIALGTDSGSADTYPGYFEHRELELMESAGMTPVQVIKAATANSAEALGLKDIGTLAPGKSANFFVLSSNPLEKLVNTKEIAKIYKNGAEMDRLKMIENIHVDTTGLKVTQAARIADAQEGAAIAAKKAEDALPHYGGFVLGTASSLRGLSIPMPKGAKTVKEGNKFTVSMNANLSQFYKEILAKNGWKTSGACWEKDSAVSKKTNTLCGQFGAGSTVLELTEK